MAFDKSATAIQVEASFHKLRVEQTDEQIYDLGDVGKVRVNWPMIFSLTKTTSSR